MHGYAGVCKLSGVGRRLSMDLLHYVHGLGLGPGFRDLGEFGSYTQRLFKGCVL